MDKRKTYIPFPRPPHQINFYFFKGLKDIKSLLTVVRNRQNKGISLVKKKGKNPARRQICISIKLYSGSLYRTKGDIARSSKTRPI